MILTVTLNAALDLTYESERFAWGEVNRVEAVHARAGGKGINVARTLRQLGCETVVTGLAGGATGEAIRAELAAAGIEDRLVPMEAESRRTVTTVSRADGVVAAFNEPGPEVSGGDWTRFRATFPGLLGGAAAVVLSGSLPRGLPASAYAELVGECGRHGVTAIVDASGDALVEALRARPALVKPNREELREVLGDAGDLDGARALRDRGAEAVVVSAGADGLCAVTPDGTWRARCPAVDGNPVGAGDALVAALTAGMVSGLPWPERLRAAAATAAAAVRVPQAGGYDPATRSRLLSSVSVERVKRP